MRIVRCAILIFSALYILSHDTLAEENQSDLFLGNETILNQVIAEQLNKLPEDLTIDDFNNIKVLNFQKVPVGILSRF